MDSDDLMRAAVEACRRGIAAGQSPFGAAVADASGRIICAVHNRVRLTGDPTAHAEIVAIREAAGLLGRIDLTGCVIAATCEPCPMCSAAIHWARLDEVLFGATIADARDAGFNELAVPCATLLGSGRSPVKVRAGVLRDECRALFDAWRRGPRPEPY